jgi:glycerate kinase
MDSSAAAGLALVPTTERKPLITSTVGVGDLVLHALEQGCRRFVIGTGDTATNDCGMGFADALGVRFLDEFRDPIPPVGQHLAGVREIDVAGLEGRLQEATFQVACNPNSVLCGKSGTARVYGPQKGAGPAEVIALDAGTECFAGLLERHVGRELRYAPGAGGGGGLAGMIHALFGGRLRFSFDVVREYVGLDAALEAADLVITGEGFLDARTLAGKLPGNIALYAKRFGKPVAAVVGGIDDGLRLLYLNGFDAIEVATPRPCDVHVAIGHADQWLPEAAARLVRKLRLGELIAQ